MSIDGAFKIGLVFLAFMIATAIADWLGVLDPYGTFTTSVWLFLITASVVAAVGTVDLAKTFHQGPSGDNRLAHLVGWGIPILLLIGWWGGMDTVIQAALPRGPFENEVGPELLGLYFFTAWIRLHQEFGH